MTHWPPLEGTKQATTVEISAVKNGKVYRVDTVASNPADCGPEGRELEQAGYPAIEVVHHDDRPECQDRGLKRPVEAGHVLTNSHSLRLAGKVDRHQRLKRDGEPPEEIPQTRDHQTGKRDELAVGPR